jgi:hypothetical protein
MAAESLKNKGKVTLFAEPQIRRRVGRRPVGNIREADPGDMLAGVDALIGPAILWVKIGGRAYIGQLRVPLEGQTFSDELFAEIAGLERIIAVAGFAGHLIEKADVLVAAGEQPEIVALASMLLGEHALEGRSFCCQFPDVRRVKPAAEDLFKILVLFDHDDDVVINRQRRRPGRPIRGHCHAAGGAHESNHAQLRRFRHVSSRERSRAAERFGACPIA